MRSSIRTFRLLLIFTFSLSLLNLHTVWANNPDCEKDNTLQLPCASEPTPVSVRGKTNAGVFCLRNNHWLR